MPRKKTTARVLTPEARTLLIQHLVAGDNNAEARAALHNAGYYADLDRSTLWYYRSLPEVREQMLKINLEVTQSGLGLRARRIELLKRLAADILLVLDNGETVTDSEGISHKGVPISALKRASLSETVMKLLAEITKLVDGPNGIMPIPPPPADGAVAEPSLFGTGCPGGTLAKGQALTLWNDIQEFMLREAGVDVDAEIETIRREEAEAAEQKRLANGDITDG